MLLSENKEFVHVLFWYPEGLQETLSHLEFCDCSVLNVVLELILVYRVHQRLEHIDQLHDEASMGHDQDLGIPNLNLIVWD